MWVQIEKVGLRKKTNWKTRKTEKGKKLKTADIEVDVDNYKKGRKVMKISKDSVPRWKRN